MIRIKQSFLQKIKEDEPLIFKIAQANDVKMAAVHRWIKANDPYLTTADNLEIIKDHFMMKETKALLERLEVIA